MLRSPLLMLIGLVMFSTPASIACRNRTQPVADAETGPAGEPENYSATVVRAIDDGVEREVSVTRVARSGEMRREDWTEQGGHRALIWRPDQGKAFLLDIDKQTYVELPLSFDMPGEPGARSPAAADRQARSHNASSRNASSRQVAGAAANSSEINADAVGGLLGDAPSPVSVEVRALADEAIGNYVCKVSERRAVFSDGHKEVTRTFRAPDLAGLPIRIEISADPQSGTEKTIIEKTIIMRRDIKTDVSPDEFVIPTGFKKVDKLPHE
jgi:hypothetical protein